MFESHREPQKKGERATWIADPWLRVDDKMCSHTTVAVP